MNKSEFEVDKSYTFHMREPLKDDLKDDLYEFNARVVLFGQDDTMAIELEDDHGNGHAVVIRLEDVRAAHLDEYLLGYCGRENDKSFLFWLHERLVGKHGENPNVDYMWKLRSLIRDTPKEKATPNRIG
jgi:hypothetical protein